ncbi:beta-xylosidase family glycoside hydrolase [Pedobacter steynii]
MDDSKPIKKPNLVADKTNFTLNDDFKGNKLKSQWAFFGELDAGRFQLSDGGLSMKGKGNQVANSAPLLCIPLGHSYTTDVELSIEGKATAGLVLFYNNTAFSGILANNKNILANIRGWQFETEKNVVNDRVFLRLKNMDNIVHMYYSTDGIKWNKIESSLDVSAIHHNVLSGFLSLRIGLCAIGEGKVTFKNFKFTPIN